jgi:hypothetical protein
VNIEVVPLGWREGSVGKPSDDNTDGATTVAVCA